MTEAEQRRFLKAEGWGRKRVIPLWGNGFVYHWKDPIRNKHFPTGMAFRIASRRKTETETRKLLKAGWRRWTEKGKRGLWRNPGGYSDYTRYEAISILEGR